MRVAGDTGLATEAGRKGSHLAVPRMLVVVAARTLLRVATDRIGLVDVHTGVQEVVPLEDLVYARVDCIANVAQTLGSPGVLLRIGSMAEPGSLGCRAVVARGCTGSEVVAMMSADKRVSSGVGHSKRGYGTTRMVASLGDYVEELLGAETVRMADRTQAAPSHYTLLFDRRLSSHSFDSAVENQLSELLSNPWLQN